jgi:predicted PurR-regulated permease PerM
VVIGPIGVVLATPLTAVVVTVVRKLYMDKIVEAATARGPRDRHDSATGRS